ncbi:MULTISPECIES: hypothetical protein [Shinella]|jgi:hypothetical protein|nr:hypothetical protein [Shinella zoogloeoides]
MFRFEGIGTRPWRHGRVFRPVDVPGIVPARPLTLSPFNRKAIRHD